VVDKLRIVHLYPDLLRTYGDRGNVMVLAQRARWRDIGAEVIPVSRGEVIPPCEIVFIGGGSDRIQRAIGTDLLARTTELRDLSVSGTVVFTVCGGYQLLGHEYRLPDGTSLAGMGLLDVTTVAGKTRLIGKVLARQLPDGDDLMGFENHGGRTYLGSSAQPLARVVRGGGNNGSDGTEGAVQGTLIGTYLHGPVLPLNPGLADRLIATALGREELVALPNKAEETARAAWRANRRGR
jgi:lipid II isoglutaminyl synthase (glutamine-hydrolysing)